MENSKTRARAAAKKPAEIAPATDFEASGAVIEQAAKDEVDMDHPAVDNNPRAGAAAEAIQIDFNDPTLSEEEAVANNLEK